jgi:hypothetical protein
MAAVLQSKKPATASERKKIYVLVGLLGVLVVSLYLSVFRDTSSPPPQGAQRPASGPARPGQPADKEVATTTPTSADPLPLELLVYPAVADGVDRNPFTFPPQPPPPPEKPPPPKPVPTIIIGNVTPASVVAGIPRGVDVTVTGKDFPVDARVLWNGRTLRTQRLTPEMLRVSLTPGEIANAGNVRVKVVSESQPTRLWSEERTFDIREAPRPTFQYIGRVGDVALVDYGGQGNQKTVRVGDVIGQPAMWKVVAISREKIDLLDIKNEIPRSVPTAKRDK